MTNISKFYKDAASFKQNNDKRSSCIIIEWGDIGADIMELALCFSEDSGYIVGFDAEKKHIEIWF